jgi:tyrosinase
VGGGLGVGGWLGEGEARAQPAARRRNWWVRESVFDRQGVKKDLESYALAVKKMKALPANNRFSWEFQAAIHWTPRNPAGFNAQEQKFFNQCPHGTEWFFSWHRAYLYYFERIVRKLSGNDEFALPYWDWDDPNRRTLPPEFRSPNHPTWGVLFHGDRNPLLNNGGALPGGPAGVDPFARTLDENGQEVSPSEMETPTFLAGRTNPGFGGGPRQGGSFTAGVLEIGTHGRVHDLTGRRVGNQAVGMASVPTAALDPIFYLHHANVDRLWDLWIVRHLEGVNVLLAPMEQVERARGNNRKGAPCLFVDENDNEVSVLALDTFPAGALKDNFPRELVASREARLLVDKERWGDRFSRAPRAPLALEIPAAQKKGLDEKRAKVFGEESRVEVAAVKQRFDLKGKPVKVEVPIAKDRAEALKLALELALEDINYPPSVILHVEDLRASAAPGVVFLLYLNEDNATAQTDPARANYVGTISLFGATGHGHGAGDPHKAPAGDNFLFDVTRLVQSLKDRGKWDEGKATVTFVSKGLGEKDDPLSEVSFQQLRITIERA